MQRRFLPLVFATLLVVGGCSHERAWRNPDLVLDEGDPVVVVPFTSRTVNNEAGEIITSLMINELRVRGVAVMAPLITPEKAPTMSTPAAVLQALGKRLRSRYLMVGEVTEYAYKRGLGEEPTVGISARLVDTISGEVVWTGVRAEVGGWSLLHEDSLARLSQRSVEKLAATLAKDEPMERQPPRKNQVRPDTLRPTTWDLAPMSLMDLGPKAPTDPTPVPIPVPPAPSTASKLAAEPPAEPTLPGPDRQLGQPALTVTGTISPTTTTLRPAPVQPAPLVPAANGPVSGQP
jgi:TolB-like protein